MYYIYSTRDKVLYEKALNRKIGDVMCTTLNQFKNKSALRLLRESGQEYKIPIDLDKILEHYGVINIPTNFENLQATDEYKDKGEILGLVLASGDNLGIFYKESDTIHRKRFTVAHELAHCCLHTDSLANGYVETRSNIAQAPDERELAANIFAGELLVPRAQLDYVLSRLIKPSLNGLAKIFKVSKQVMRSRLEYLGITYYDDDVNKLIVLEN